MKIILQYRMRLGDIAHALDGLEAVSLKIFPHLDRLFVWIR